ncbi:DUF2189 domain-containing protein [Rhodovibrio salinarum]|uniref:DUF2189 domain-containing protein n=2 Tax=Rhodovibrio salinarum TaxID=1087 RepID=A0A934QKE0_9PROT|nr:DUF2189 domain-containing protein [Rhodovibrio salinarum]
MPLEDAREHQRVFVRQITRDDLRDALDKGAHDFFQKPTHVVFLVAIYPIVALVLSRLTFGYEILPILFPLAAGFALLGPVAAIGLYELSRRREKGEQPSWYDAFKVLQSPALKSIIGLGAILAVVFVLWLAVAWLIFAATLGAAPPSVTGFLGVVFTTAEGWTMMIIGNLVGALFAFVVLVISWISFPMIIDQHVDVATAVKTSLRAVVGNPVPAITWGLIVVAGLVLGSLPLFVGLAITLPVLGHATWHVYRKLVSF